MTFAGREQYRSALLPKVARLFKFVACVAENAAVFSKESSVAGRRCPFKCGYYKLTTQRHGVYRLALLPFFFGRDLYLCRVGNNQLINSKRSWLNRVRPEPQKDLLRSARLLAKLVRSTPI